MDYVNKYLYNIWTDFYFDSPDQKSDPHADELHGTNQKRKQTAAMLTAFINRGSVSTRRRGSGEWTVDTDILASSRQDTSGDPGERFVSASGCCCGAGRGYV